MFYFTYGKNKQNKLLRNAFFVGILEAAAKKRRILIRNPVYGFIDPDPYKMSRIRKTGYFYSAFVSIDLNGCFKQCCGSETKVSDPVSDPDPA
jgi:hypothetical protein